MSWVSILEDAIERSKTICIASKLIRLIQNAFRLNSGDPLGLLW